MQLSCPDGLYSTCSRIVSEHSEEAEPADGPTAACSTPADEPATAVQPAAAAAAAAADRADAHKPSAAPGAAGDHLPNPPPVPEGQVLSGFGLQPRYPMRDTQKQY